MFKTLIISILSTAIIIACTACGGGSSNDDSKNNDPANCVPADMLGPFGSTVPVCKHPEGE